MPSPFSAIYDGAMKAFKAFRDIYEGAAMRALCSLYMYALDAVGKPASIETWMHA